MARQHLRLIIFWVFMMFIAQSGHAETTKKIPWSSLSTANQQVLKTLAPTWDSMSSERQARILSGLNRWHQLDNEEKQHLKERFKQWKSLTPEQRTAIRKRFHTFLKLPPSAQRQAVENYKLFKNLPSDSQTELKNRSNSFSPTQKRKILNRLKQRNHRLQSNPRSTQRRLTR